MIQLDRIKTYQLMMKLKTKVNAEMTENSEK